MNTIPYHIPVMLQPCMEGLSIDPNGIYVDLTFGGGGHSKEILARLENGHLYGFDQDDDAEPNVPDDTRFTFVQANFRDFKKYLKLYKVAEVDGVLADLGISSHQIDEPTRGFSTRFEGVLDMRMGQGQDLMAKDILNTYEESQLHKIFGIYGEVKNAKTLAHAVISRRATMPFEGTVDFKDFLKPFTPRGKEFKYYAQVFQALRIEVNDELKALEEMLLSTIDSIKKDGRLVIISYHSLEDRLVKNFMNKGKFHGEAEKDFYGNLIRPFEPVTRKAIVADEEEVRNNNRARSARLRVAKKL